MIRSQKSYAQYLMQLWCCLLPFQSPFAIVTGQVTSTCISSINDFETAESALTDFSVVRQYILCPETTFTIGRQDHYGTTLFDTGSHMIHLRPNLHIQCGDSGSRTNNCVISGGTVQMDGTAFFGSNSTSGTALSNVIITGLTFTNVEKHHIWIEQPGDVVIRDCVFQVRCLVYFSNARRIQPLSFGSTVSTVYIGFQLCNYTCLFGLL
jgi:hypothetical protein